MSRSVNRKEQLKNLTFLFAELDRHNPEMEAAVTVVGHKMSDEIQVYRFDSENCSLEPAGNPVKAWKPLCFVFTGKEEGRGG